MRGNGGTVIGTSGLFEYDGRRRTFRQTRRPPPNGTQWAVTDADNRHWTIDQQNRVFRERTVDRGNYQQITGTAASGNGTNVRQVVIGGDEVFALNETGAVFQYNSGINRFEPFENNSVFRRIAVDPDGILWVINNNGFIQRYLDGEAINVPERGLQKANEIAIGANGSVFIIDGNTLKSYSASNDRFDRVTLNFSNPTQLAVDNRGQPYISNGSEIYRVR